MSLISPGVSVVLVNTNTQRGTVLLPPTTEIPNRVLTIKDSAGNCSRSSCSISTSGPDLFEDGTNIKSISTTFGFYELTASTNRWFIRSTTQPAMATFVNTYGTSVVASTIQASTIRLSTLQIGGLPIYVSTNNLLYWGNTLIESGPVAQTPQVFF
jgi:hypothetical protein